MIRNIKKWILAIARNSMVQHLLFWGLSWSILLNMFTGASSFQKIDFIYTSIFLMTLMIPVELNLLLFIPRFLNRKKYVIYSLLFIASLLLFSFFNQLLFDRLIDHILPGYYFISYYSYFDILKFFLVFMIVTTLLHLSKEWFDLNEARQRMILLEKEKIDAELRALSNQVNPHFLFNSLNVLYSLAIKNAQETPEAIIKLSDILRYVIYESNHETVELHSEIKLINNFIDLQYLRTSPDADIQFDHEMENEKLQIAPMLFLPLVENSYKHGIKGEVGKTFIKMKLMQKGNEVEFLIENNKGISGEPVENQSGGVGLNNIRSRLELIYPKNHTFEMEDGENLFSVKLKIKTKT
ncbi:MAG: histidine kinase [Bacteroidales bacterium]|nr:histidine kinase [Bacteroidales bacterium]